MGETVEENSQSPVEAPNQASGAPVETNTQGESEQKTDASVSEEPQSPTSPEQPLTSEERKLSAKGKQPPKPTAEEPVSEETDKEGTGEIDPSSPHRGNYEESEGEASHEKLSEYEEIPKTYDTLLGDESSASDETEDVYEEDYPKLLPDDSLSQHRITPVTIRKSLKKKEVKIGTEPPIEDLGERSEDDEDDDWIWVEEEISEEIEVETDEEIGEEESVEEESEGEYREGSEEEIEKEGEEGVEAEEEYVEKVEIEEVVGEQVEEEEVTEVIKEEIKEIPPEAEGQEEEIDTGYMEEQLEEAEEEEGSEEEEVEEEMELMAKKKRKFKTIKVFKMIRMRRRDAIKRLKDKAAPIEDRLQEPVEEEEEEDEKENEALEMFIREREKSIELIKTLANQVLVLNRKNKLLSRTIIDHYKQKKVDNVQQTEMPSSETFKRYYKRLKLFKDAKLTAAAEKDRMLNDTELMANELKKITKEYEREKAELLAWESEVGRTVITAQTGRPMEESVILHITQRHDSLLQQVSIERLTLVTLLNEMSSVEDKIKKLVQLGDNLNLIDFEQLKMDNQMSSDKLEERENELGNLRKKILEIIHVQAHVLEKSDSIKDDIEHCNETHRQLETEVTQLRESVNKLKKKRDLLRGNTSKLKNQAGLLIRPRLAIDYENAVVKIEEGRLTLANLKKTYNRQRCTIEQLRRQIGEIATYKFFQKP